jgi:hypothetical protein
VSEKKDVLDYLKEDRIPSVLSQEIIDIFEATASKDTVDYEFVIEKGTGQLKDREPNTTFIFDANPGTTLYAFKKALFERVINKEEMAQVITFCQEVSSILSDRYKDRIRSKIREIVMPDSTPETIPMDDVSVREIEISDADAVPAFAKSTIKIAKSPGSQINTEAVVKRLSELQEESEDLTANEIFAKNREDPAFVGVADIIQGKKFLFDATLKIFVDYAYKAPESPETPELKLVG